MRAAGNTGNGEPPREAPPLDPPPRPVRVPFDLVQPLVMPGVGTRKCPHGMLFLLTDRIECPGCGLVWRVRP